VPVETKDRRIEDHGRWRKTFQPAFYFIPSARPHVGAAAITDQTSLN